MLEYEKLPDLLPAGEYRVEVIFYSIIDGIQRNLTRVLMRGEVKTTTAEQWRK